MPRNSIQTNLNFDLTSVHQLSSSPSWNEKQKYGLKHLFYKAQPPVVHCLDGIQGMASLYPRPHKSTSLFWIPYEQSAFCIMCDEFHNNSAFELPLPCRLFCGHSTFASRILLRTFYRRQSMPQLLAVAYFGMCSPLFEPFMRNWPMTNTLFCDAWIQTRKNMVLEAVLLSSQCPGNLSAVYKNIT